MPRVVTQAGEPELTTELDVDLDAELKELRPRPDTLEVIWTLPPDPAAPSPSATDPTGTDADPSIKSAPEELRELLVQLKSEHRRRRSVRHARILTGAVAVGLLAVWLLRPPIPGGDENRAQTLFPKLDASSIASGSAFRQADAALRDRLALREYVVTAVGNTAKNKLGVSLTPKVVLGDGGTPFLGEDFTLPCERPFDAAAVNSSLERLRAIGARTGKTITVAIAPDKSSILTSQLGRTGSALMACSNRVKDATQAQWPGNKSPVVTMWKQMAGVEAAEPGQVYQHGDTHWTSRGALVFSRQLLRQLVAQGEAPAALAGEPSAFRGADSMDDADLYRMLGTPRLEEVPNWLVRRPGVTVTSKSQDTPSGEGIQIYHADAPADVPMITGTTLVVHDSFFGRVEPQVAPYFQNLTVMHWADFLTRADDGTLPHFDRVILETVQRGWPQRASWIESGQNVYDALATELARPGRSPKLEAARK